MKDGETFIWDGSSEMIKIPGLFFVFFAKCKLSSCNELNYYLESSDCIFEFNSVILQIVSVMHRNRLNSKFYQTSHFEEGFDKMIKLLEYLSLG